MFKQSVNNQDAGGLRRHRAHYDVTLMNYKQERSKLYIMFHNFVNLSYL